MIDNKAHPQAPVNTRRQIVAAITPALLLTLNLLIFGTFLVFIQNRGEFQVSYTSILSQYYLPALLLIALISLLYLLPSKRFHLALNAIVILLGLMTYTHGNLLTWDTGVLDGTPLDLSKTWRSVTDAGLWLAAAVLCFRYRQLLLTHGWKICLVLIVFQLAGAVQNTIVKRPETPQQSKIMPPHLARFSRAGNVVHIILDGFQSTIFEELLEEHPEIRQKLAGFTFFRGATTSSDVTYLSVPATLTGKPFKNQEKISAYHAHTLGADNLYTFMAAHDYSVDVATPLWWNKQRSLFSSYYPIPTPYANAQETRRSSALLLADLSLYRQTPHFLKSLVYQQGNWLFSHFLVTDPAQQFEQFSHNHFLTDLTSRLVVNAEKPTYKFIHLVTPHPPFVSGDHCQFSGGVLEYSKAAFKQQSYCTLLNVVAFLQQLQIAGIYKQSLILIHGDHGGGIPFDMHEINGNSTSSERFLHRVWGNPLPLVLIKPPDTLHVLKTSDNTVQLPDIPLTVATLLGLKSNFPGRAMFSPDPQSPRDRFFYYSTIHRNEAASKDYYEQFLTYKISGSVFQTSSWQEMQPYAAPVTDAKNSYQWGRVISFGINGNSHPFQDGGWVITRSQDVTWTHGKRTSLAINFPQTSEPVIMSAIIKPLISPGKLERQRVKVLVGETLVDEWFETGNRFHSVEVRIPPALFNPNGKTEIHFELPDARAPAELGTGTDKRILGLAFMSLEFNPEHIMQGH